MPTAGVRIGSLIFGVLAETEGFEPSVPFKRYDALAKRWFQPLTHVSRPVPSAGYSEQASTDQHPFSRGFGAKSTRVIARSLRFVDACA
jgi:hypothetical protein